MEAVVRTKCVVDRQMVIKISSLFYFVVISFMGNSSTVVRKLGVSHQLFHKLLDNLSIISTSHLSDVSCPTFGEVRCHTPFLSY